MLEVLTLQQPGPGQAANPAGVVEFLHLNWSRIEGRVTAGGLEPLILFPLVQRKSEE
jgi:hypothetical protein